MTDLDDNDGVRAPGNGQGAAEHDEGAPTGGGKKPISDLSEIGVVRDYLMRIGAEARSMRTAVVKEFHGRYWRDVATIKLDGQTGKIKVKCGDASDASAFAPTDAEASAIEAACAQVKWPEPLPLQEGPFGPPLPPALRDVDRENIFALHDEEGRVVMLQRRATDAEVEAGAPKYQPWSHWDDGRWRPMEPGGPLPLWGTSQLKHSSVVFLHEGAKAARAVARMVAENATRDEKLRLAAHPWGESLKYAAHLGWIGGALSPDRTDWSILKKEGVTRVYIVSDNDKPGKEAVPKIARHLRVPTFHISFTDEFPNGFDLADQFPAKMFSADGRYCGPPMQALVEPATWATDFFSPPTGGKPRPYLRECFKNQWVYADEPELFICTADTRIIRTAVNLSNKLLKYSDSPGTARLLLKACEHVTTPAYAPDCEKGTVTVRGQRAFNIFRPSEIKPPPGDAQPGDAQPWREFLGYLFPVAEERKQVERWCATLIARPQVRMHFGLLLASETQGVGKGIFATQVLAPLVGDHNVGYPSEHDIAESAFNDWMAHKRLIIVGEIYQGQSFKAYNRLKGVITDKDFVVNKKHQPPYRIDNWCHVVACSNSDKALKMEKSDRRWFYPKVNEEPWLRYQFEEFVQWLESGGLNIIAQWAKDYDDYVKTGELPVMTERKQIMIAESEAEELRWVREYCAGRIEDNENFVISTAVALAYAKKTFAKNIYTTKLSLGREMEKEGMCQLVNADGREFFLKYLNDRHRVYLSPAAQEELNDKEKKGEALVGEELKKWLRDKLTETVGEMKIF